MRVMMMHRHKGGKSPEPTPQLFEDMGRLIDDMTKAGVFVVAGGFGPDSKAKRLSFANGKMTVTDGPFAESKEMIAGFCLVEVTSIEEAIKWAGPFARLVGDVEIDVRTLA